MEVVSDWFYLFQFYGFHFSFFLFRFKGDNQIMTDSEDPHHIYVSDNTLTVNRFVENDAGFYTCKLFNANNGFIEKKEFNVAC